ncbi:MAG: cytochrome c [Cytophagales bacterium]|nr:cytochrome c [Cytophagales bacterium]
MRIKLGIWGVAGALLLAGCKAGGDYQGLEYAPNMYHSVAYEPLTQITDEGYGVMVNSLDNGRGEYYNTNKFNPFAMNMRLPAPNTVRRTANGWLPYRGANDTTGLRLANKLINPLAESPAILDQGKLLYEINCKHCHGAKGAGDGKVADKYPGVANLTGDAIKGVTEGHIFHVITYGKGLMGAHGSQVSEEERWKIARYVKQLQKN